MTTSDKRPRRTTKTAKNVIPPADLQAGNGAAEGRETEKAGAPSDAGPAAQNPSIKAINVTVTSRHYEDRHASIAKAAYFRSEIRGFAPGHEIEDWLAAEEEVDQRLLGEGRVS
jgi:hypothetical protein